MQPVRMNSRLRPRGREAGRGKGEKEEQAVSARMDSVRGRNMDA
jgi:hypothetical protein